MLIVKFFEFATFSLQVYVLLRFELFQIPPSLGLKKRYWNKPMLFYDYVDKIRASPSMSCRPLHTFPIMARSASQFHVIKPPLLQKLRLCCIPPWVNLMGKHSIPFSLCSHSSFVSLCPMYLMEKEKNILA